MTQNEPSNTDHDTVTTTPPEVTQVTKQVVKELYRKPMLQQRRATALRRAGTGAGVVAAALAVELLNPVHRARLTGLTRGLTRPGTSRDHLDTRLERNEVLLKQIDAKVRSAEARFGGPRRSPWALLALGAALLLWRRPQEDPDQPAVGTP